MPVLCLASGVVEFLNVHPEYDMKAISLVWGCFMAVASALSWLMERALSDTLRSALGAIVRPLSAQNDDGR